MFFSISFRLSENELQRILGCGLLSRLHCTSWFRFPTSRSAPAAHAKPGHSQRPERAIALDFSSRSTSSVAHHARWLTLVDAAHEFDRGADDTPIPHREATRLISASQFGAGIWLEAAPDASLPGSRLRSGPYIICLLYTSDAADE